MGKAEKNKKIKREALLSTAFELFTSKGIQDTSISDIVKSAGIGKGTFYLYFKDKYDINNLLISHKSSQLFLAAISAVEKEKIEVFEDKIIFIVNHILDQLNEDKTLLRFISKNLSWGYFKSALIEHSGAEDVDFYEQYQRMIREAEYKIEEPEIMLFMIIELVSATCYSSILYAEPVGLEELKPYLFRDIRNIIRENLPERGKDNIKGTLTRA